MRGPLISHREDPRRLSAAIYGLIVVVSLLAVYDNDTGKTLVQIGLGILVTAFVFWLAHVYTEVVGQRRDRGRKPTLREIREAAVEMWPLIGATLLPVAIVLLGATSLLERATAIDLAMALCLGELLLIGAALARDEGATLRQSIVSGLVSLSFGIVVIALKALVH